MAQSKGSISFLQKDNFVGRNPNFSHQYQNQTLPWLRWWDRQGNLLLTGWERAEQVEQRAKRAEQRAERLAAQLRAQGIEPDP